MGGRVDLQTRRALLEHLAPRYREAPSAKKSTLLDEFTAITGYHRKYATWLLNHVEEALQASARPHQHYGSEVQHALVLVWETLNQIGAKRVIPFLPTMLESLERHGYVHLSEESRRRLLAMSAATAERILSSHRHRSRRGLSKTKAGTLLKQQIPIRTYREWDEAKPGFLEADLVAHCGGHSEGNYLYTLTLTDISTGWTECLPLLHKGQEAVLNALQRARTLFPFPILGIDTDNGSEFINEEVVAYCEREQITFTRGRPYEKNDQCYIEQKNRVVVRQVVGHERLLGEHTHRQLTELYRALRLYVNCFQPSMKLIATYHEERKVRRVYDAAKSPLQRLFLSEVLPASKQEELNAVAQALDPIRLFHQLEGLQHAVFRCAVDRSPVSPGPSVASLQVFSLQACIMRSLPAEITGPDRAPARSDRHQESQESQAVLDWPRTSKGPFAGQWEQISSWIQADPTRSSGDLFRQLQDLSPGRYQPLDIRTLQRGMRKIRARLLQTREEQWQTEVIHGDVPEAVKSLQEKPAEQKKAGSLSPSSPAPSVDPSPANVCVQPRTSSPNGAGKAGRTRVKTARVVEQSALTPDGEEDQAFQACQVSPTPAATERQEALPVEDHGLTIEQAIQAYLQHQRRAKRRPKTLEWHRTALGQFQQYLSASRHLLQVSQITEADTEREGKRRQCAPDDAGVNVSGSSARVFGALSPDAKGPYGREKDRRRSTLSFRAGSCADEKHRDLALWPAPHTSRGQ